MLKKRLLILLILLLSFSLPANGLSFSALSDLYGNAPQEAAQPSDDAPESSEPFSVSQTEDEMLSQTDSVPAEETVSAELTALIEAQFRASKAKTGVFIVSRYGNPLAVYITGYRDTHKNETNLYTTYHIASVTKMVTAIGFMQLYEQGLIGLDDPINDYLPMKVANPACPEIPITMRQVLSHTSTIKQTSKYHPDWENLKVSNSYFYRNLEPGEKYHYANLNGGLCGAMIEAISAQSINQYMTEHLFAPLDIDAAYSPTLLKDQENIGALMTRGGVTTSNASRQLKAAADYDDTCDPKEHTDRTAGSLYISAEGLNRIMTMMVSGGTIDGIRVLQESTIRLMEADQSLLAPSSVKGTSPYGLFVAHYQFDGPTWYGHQGRFNGLTSDAFYQPETGLTFVMIVNGYSGKSNDGLCNLARKCMTLIDQWQAEAAMEFDRFLTYSLRHNRPVKVLIQAEKMKYVNLTVIAMDQETFSCRQAGKKNPVTFSYDQVLAVTYARGDDGDTLKNELMEQL